MSVNPSQEQFQKAALEHLEAARRALGDTGGCPRSSAYLGHVSVECLLKCRLLQMYSKPRTDEMETALGEELFGKLFRSASGHNLGMLAQYASLKRLLFVERKEALLRGGTWERMRNDARPYSLRYGTTRMRRSEATEELEFASAITETISAAGAFAQR